VISIGLISIAPISFSVESNLSSTKSGFLKKRKRLLNSKKSRDNIPKNKANWLAKELGEVLVFPLLYVISVRLLLKGLINCCILDYDYLNEDTIT
jgi:hypothetical protein